jgi:hypothetical protein
VGSLCAGAAGVVPACCWQFLIVVGVVGLSGAGCGVDAFQLRSWRVGDFTRLYNFEQFWPLGPLSVRERSECGCRFLTALADGTSGSFLRADFGFKN